VPCLSSARHSPSAVLVTVRISSRVLVFFPVPFLAGDLFGFSSAGTSAAGAGVVAAEMLSVEAAYASNASKSVDGASTGMVSTVIVRRSPPERGPRRASGGGRSLEHTFDPRVACCHAGIRVSADA
jgi:hypothetical protein